MKIGYLFVQTSFKVGELRLKFAESLCRAKRLIYVTTAGGPIMNYNFGFDYVSALAQLYYGIPDVRCFSAEMLDIIGADVPAIMADAKAAIDKDLGE